MYILFDIGGTKTRVAQTDDLHSLGEVKKFPTPCSYYEGLDTIVSAINELKGGEDIVAIAGGIRGPLNHEKTAITSDTKLVDWVGRSIVDDLKKAFNVPVYLENDSALVGLGEAVFGAGKEYDIVAYHTVSTGVGGARFVSGKLDATSIGFEPGHQIVDVDRTILGLHTPPTLQNLVSGTALEKRRGVKPYEIDQSDEVWDELAKFLAAGLKNTIVYWSPDVIVLGGSMILGDPRINLEPIERYTKEIVEELMPCPPIVDAMFRDDGGLYGGMARIAQMNN